MKQAKREILIAEDDRKIAAILSDFLLAEGHSPTVVSDGLTAVETVRKRPPSALLLDLGLPLLDGVEVCRKVRTFSAVPIIMITARVDEVERLLGLSIGADDYICKPFSPKEVMARLHALLRRSEGKLSMAAADTWTIDDDGMRIAHAGQFLALTPIEFRLLRSFLAQPGRVFARHQLLDKLHEDYRDVNDRAIDSHIKNVRKKMSAAGADPDSIAAIYGVGYRYTPKLVDE
ncbi:response regulator [Dokdonella sp.]|uniref:response regulator n=1 Tax=Dokdonella sp. TaxID=2291710 RepID=UPI003C476C5F